MAELPFTRTADGVLLTVRLTPKASSNAIRGIDEESDGTACLKVAVTVVPEGGKANAALLKLLAKTWKLPKTSLEIASGVTSRRKVVRIAGDPDALYEHLTDWGRKFQ
jgi:uncharacterized protein (TIGR00251 family)